jgi:hypothetical protein
VAKRCRRYLSRPSHPAGSVLGGASDAASATSEFRALVTDVQALVDSDTAVVSFQVVEPHPVGDILFETHTRRVETDARGKGA